MSRRRPLLCPECGTQLGWTRSGKPIVFRTVVIRVDLAKRNSSFVCPECGAERTWDHRDDSEVKPAA